MNSAGHAVLELQVHLWYTVLGEDGGIRDITCKRMPSVLVPVCGGVPFPALYLFQAVVEDVRMAADSTMLRMVNLLMALSLGVHLEQLEHLTGLT